MGDARKSDRNKEQHEAPDEPIKRPIDPKRVLQILECRRKIMAFVESMLEAEITQDKLKSGEELICRGDYDSIVQERYILKICGYPLCSNKLVKEWKQRYHISLREKRVFDVEQRKLFCSVICMDQSTEYRDKNLSEQPIWIRLDNLKIDMGPEQIRTPDHDPEDICTFNFL